MADMTFGQMMLADILPPDIYQPGVAVNKKRLTDMMSQVAQRYPDRYADIAHRLVRLGLKSGESMGGASFGLKDLATSPAVLARQEEIRNQMKELLDNTPEDQQQEAIVKLLRRHSQEVPELVYRDGVANKNRFTLQLEGAGRGNKKSLASMMAGDILVENSVGDPIPVPISRGYGQGQTLGQYYATAYGARRGITATKLSVGSSGYFSKLLQQAGHRLVVVGDDDDKADPDEQRGLLVDAADPDNVGALLARDIGPYRRNTVITPSMLTALHRLGNGQVLIRSPIASSSLSGGLYARDVGVREFGRLARRGEHVGNPASQAIGEQVTQMSLCLAEGTLVRMADMTTKQIQDVVPGDRVLGADTNCNAFPVRVLNTFKNGDKEVYRTEFRYPYQTRPMLLESSLDHKLLSSRFTTGQKSDADNYIPTVSPVGRSGSKVYAHPVERIQCETEPGPGRDFAFLIGYLIGNGCYTEPVTRGGGGPMLSCDSESTLVCLQEAAAKFGYSVNFHKGSQCYYRLVMDTQTIDQRDAATGRVLPGVRNIFKKWLRDRGMWCKYSYEKVLPEDVKRWDDDSLRGILQGLFASDGTAYELESAGYPHVGYGSTSRELVEQIMWLLQFRVGVYPGELATSRLGDRKRVMHSINISHLCLLRRFLDWIGTIPGDRGVRLHRSVSAAESLRQRGVGYYARRHSQNRVGVMPTYDLEVDHPDHLFVLANGLIVSNSAKHSGGAAGDEKTQPGLSGFALVERLANPPKEGRGLAIHAQHDGKVQDVRPAPQGGTYLTIGGKEHYVPADFTMTVRQGDVVEAGDELTDGVADPAEVVRHKGIGEGRRYFVNSMRRALQESGAPVDRRNLELLATGLINRVRVDRQFGEFMPGSLVSYGRVEKLYRPRKDSQRTALEGAAGRYLERPALHYSIGTRLTPKILDGLKRGGIKEVVSHTEAPPFTAVPVRAADALQSDPDFMTQFFGSHLQKNLLKSIQAGGESDENSTSFVPLRAGGVNLGRPGFLLSGS